MQIIMNETRRGCEDGFTIRNYLAGQEYDLCQSQATAFIRSGHASPVVPFNVLDAVSEILERSARHYETHTGAI